jgi:hypothetical protein
MVDLKLMASERFPARLDVNLAPWLFYSTIIY